METLKHKTKSVLIARKKRVNENDINRPCFVSLFEKNDPHLNTEGPTKVIEFDQKHKVLIKGLDVHYLLPGNDIVINNLEEVDVIEDGEIVHVTGRQSN